MPCTAKQEKERTRTAQESRVIESAVEQKRDAAKGYNCAGRKVYGERTRAIVSEQRMYVPAGCEIAPTE